MCFLWAIDSAASLKDKISFVDSVLYYRYKSKNVDTFYLARPEQRWKITANAYLSRNNFDVITDDARISFQSDNKATVSLGFNYLVLGFSVSINPETLMGKYSDYELNFNSYGNVFGGDIIFKKSVINKGTFFRKESLVGEEFKGIINTMSLNVNVYYALNNKRFSFPSAFSQSYIQKRSQGSWLVGLAVQGQEFKSKGSSVLDSLSFKARCLSVGAGAGYGHNFVLKKWLFHLSSIPALLLYDSMTFNNSSDFSPFKVVITTRGAVLYSSGKFLAGSNLIFNFTNSISTELFKVNDNKWQFNTFVGWRF